MNDEEPTYVSLDITTRYPGINAFLRIRLPGLVDRSGRCHPRMDPGARPLAGAHASTGLRHHGRSAGQETVRGDARLRISGCRGARATHQYLSLPGRGAVGNL